MTNIIDYYFATPSPWAYFATPRIKKIEDKWVENNFEISKMLVCPSE